jgi:hypothetical protein
VGITTKARKTLARRLRVAQNASAARS